MRSQDSDKGGIRIEIDRNIVHIGSKDNALRKNTEQQFSQLKALPSQIRKKIAELLEHLWEPRYLDNNAVYMEGFIETIVEDVYFYRIGNVTIYIYPTSGFLQIMFHHLPPDIDPDDGSDLPNIFGGAPVIKFVCLGYSLLPACRMSRRQLGGLSPLPRGLGCRSAGRNRLSPVCR